MNSEFELFAGVLMDERRAIDGIFFDFGWKRDWAYHFRVVPFGGFDNLTRRIIDKLVVVRLDAKPHFLGQFGFFLFHDEFIANQSRIPSPIISNLLAIIRDNIRD